MNLNTLDRACKEALPECEKLLEKLGLSATVGSEIEWYALLPDKMERPMTQKQMADEFLAIAKAHPQLLTDTRIFPASHEVMKSLSQALREGDTPNIEQLAMERANRIAKVDIRCAIPLNAAIALLKLRVAARMHEEGIPLNQSKNESGEFRSALTVVGHDDEKYLATGQQLEISLGVSSPTQQVQWLERMRHIIDEESRSIGLRADFRSRLPYVRPSYGELINKALPSSSRHIHYGLRFAADNANAFTSDDKNHNIISESCNISGIGLLKQGGQLLANHGDNDFERIRAHAEFNNIGHYLGIGPKHSGKHFVIRECNDVPGNEHKEMRLAGSASLASAGVLLATLSLVDGALKIIGKTPGRISGITSTINEANRAKLKQAKEETGRYTFAYNREEAETSFAAAKAKLTPNSMLAQYTPEVFSALSQLQSSDIAR